LSKNQKVFYENIFTKKNIQYFSTFAFMKFGMFGGVFTPTLLTILGVIMYLRLGWVVGNAGLLGAWLVILLSFGITICTALSMSSIITNIRIGAGGAYAIISQSLGLEVGGSLGIPRYISQGLAVTMYIFGFREGWQFIFPEHPAFLVDCAVFFVLYAIAYKSADLAIRTQYIIMVVIFASFISIAFAAYDGSMGISSEDAIRWGTFGENTAIKTDFWVVFAVFFPAATGIMAGANMSGELEDPKSSIPKGTLYAIGISLVIYLILAYWIARSATEEELLTNFNVMIDKSFWPPAIIAGILGATFSSALASIIGSSRILFAMGEHQVLPKSKWLSFQNKTGQPRNAMIVTGILIFATMLLRDLNAIAPLVTMFFLITYAMLNVVVIIEQKLGLVSFRPVFKVNKFIPWIGLISSVMAMFIINPVISLLSILVVVVVYGILNKSHLETPFEDVRSGMFSSFAEWAAKHTAGLEHKQERAWKPNFLVPVTDAAIVNGTFSFIKDVVYPKGYAMLLGIGEGENEKRLKDKLPRIADGFKEAGIFSSWTIMRTESFADGVNFSNQAMRGAFFKPNVIFLNMVERGEALTEFPKIIKEAARLEIGVVLYARHPKAGLGQKQNINIWISDRGPDWQIEEGIGNLHLSMLLSYKLTLNWGANVRIITVVKDQEMRSKAMRFMQQMIDLARLPHVQATVLTGKFQEEIQKAPTADLNVFGLPPELDFDKIRKTIKMMDSTCLFVLDSGIENVTA
jgi:solute carrier family 12 sodium/potassium/chloride transporter 2